MRVKWQKIIEGAGDTLPRGAYLVSNGNTLRVFWHLVRGKDLCERRSRTYGKEGIDWTHYAYIQNLPPNKELSGR